MSRSRILYALALAVLSTFFLSSGLIINSLNAHQGNHWAWTASLRFLLAVPVLFVLVAVRGKFMALLQAMRKMPMTFVLWGNLGFGVYYALLSYAIGLVPGWLVTAGFMTTVLAGVLISPFIYQDHRAQISKRALLLSSVLVLGLLIMQFDRISSLEHASISIAGIGMAIIAAFLWPLGNRKLMLKLEENQIPLDPMQRILGMTIGGLPILFLLALYGYYSSGMPSLMQLETSFLAVLLSGVVGTVLFFKAMQMVSRNHMALLAVEATQVIGVLFTLLGEMFFKGTNWPGVYGNLGFLVISVALSAYCILSLGRRSAASLPV